MASEGAHVNQAEKNHRFYQRIIEPDSNLAEFNDWAITGLFYSALHYVDALFDSRGSIHPSSHRQRNFLLAQTTEFRPIARDYLELYDRSQDARYNLVSFTSTQVGLLEAEKFQPIQQHVRKLLHLS